MAWKLLILFSLTFVFSGCAERTSRTDNSDNPQVEIAVSGEEIFARVIERYRMAASYQDQAVLYLSYRLNGRAIEEPHRWGVAWDRQHRFSADLFNSRIQCDGKWLSCYVFDIESENVGNQHLMLSADRISRLLDDRIARHFICGINELPLDEWETQTAETFLPPPLGFLDSNLKMSWLNPGRVRRLADEEFNGRRCFVLSLAAGDKEFQLWVDQLTWVIWQMKLPLQFLDSQILASPDVADLDLRVRFHGAELDGAIDPSRTALTERPGAKHVRYFVKLPEKLPSSKIGQSSAELTFYEPADSKPFRIRFGAKGTALLWIAAGFSPEVIEHWQAIAADEQYQEFEFAAVYADDLLQDPSASSLRLQPSIASVFDAAGLTAWYDKQMSASQQIGLEVIPSVVLFDSRGQIQFVAAIDNDWHDKLRSALVRVRNGEALFQEMLAEYQQFVHEYAEQLEIASADGTQATPLKSEALTPLWTVESMTNPGNIHILSELKRIVVLDGWQTVVELDYQGNVVRRVSLDVPTGVAINRIRSTPNGAHEPLIAVFSMLGKQAFVFDKNWQRVGEFPLPDSADPQSAISECQLVDDNDVNPIGLFVSRLDKSGIQRLDRDSRRVELVAVGPCQGFVAARSKIWRLQQKKLVVSDSITPGPEDWKSVGGLEDWNINRVYPLSGERACLAVGNDAQDQWRLFGIDDREAAWSAQIGSQRFETEIDSLSSVPSGNRTLVQVISDDQSLRLFSVSSTEAKLLAQVDLTVKPSGAALINGSDGLVAIISDGKNVTARVIGVSQ